MFIVHFCGGLGNQIFQYAFMRRLEIEHPKADIYADLTDYRQYDFHYGYELEKVFGIKVQEADDKDIEKLSGKTIYKGKLHSYCTRLIYKLIGLSKKDTPKNYFNAIYGSFADVNNKLDNIKDNDDIYFDGFWQRPEFYALADKSLKEDCVFLYDKTNELQKVIDQVEMVNSVSVHVRRGDYVGTNFDIVELDYYERAISYIKKHVANPKFFFFSDDINYVKSVFDYVNDKEIVDINHGSKSYLDMMLMTKCKHNIVAYSSFSYWGAHLNTNIDKFVISPKIGTRKDIQRLADREWILL